MHESEPSDDSLMVAVQEGDLDKMGILFQRHHGHVYGYLCSLTGKSHAAEDLTQDVFLRALKYRHSFKSQLKFASWLFRIARNAYYDWARREGRNLTVLDDPDHYHEEPSLTREDIGFGRQNDLDLLRQALDNLPEAKREVILLSRFQGLKCEEIAHVLDCKLGTVKARIFRALQALKKEFENLTEGVSQ